MDEDIELLDEEAALLVDADSELDACDEIEIDELMELLEDGMG